MAIVTISRIQHRRGYYENLPQLSSAELGWAVDQRRLFIGNGTLSEGAPEVGNTEILTQYSNVLEIAETYTFKNEDAGYNPTTGPDANSPTVRTLQKKLDDFVSVKDFGAKGDGSTDDTDAINRALFELYCRETFSGAKKTLYFPAGHYILTDIIKVPPHATLIGEGPYSTVLEQTGDATTVGAIIHSSDDLQQIEGSIGSNGANLPSDIKIAHMGMITNKDGIHIQKTKRITLERIRIEGVESFPEEETNSETGTPGIAIYLGGSSVSPSEDVNIIDCYLHKNNYAIWQDNNNQVIQNVNISSTTFDNLYKAILIGVTGGSAKNFVVTNSVFDNIYSYAVDIDNVEDYVSSFNHYKNVGNNYLGIGSPSTNVILFRNNVAHSASLGDLFDRTDIDNSAVPRISLNTNSSYFNFGKKLNLGYYAQYLGKEVELTNNTTDSTGIVIDTTEATNAEIQYTIERNGDIRSGVLKVSLDGVTYGLDDDSTETADVGVIFDVSYNVDLAEITYTTTNTGINAFLQYAIRQLSSVV